MENELLEKLEYVLNSLQKIKNNCDVGDNNYWIVQDAIQKIAKVENKGENNEI